MNFKSATAALLLSLMFGTGCMRRTVTQDFGLSGISSPPRATRSESARVARARQGEAANDARSLNKHPSPSSPDASLRAVFKEQTRGAFNPLSDDPHVQGLQARLKSNPQDIPARIELASVYESYKLYDSALDQYKEALRQLPAGDALSGKAAVGLSNSARASHRIAEAIPLLESAIAQQPASNSWNELGLLYENIRSLPAAQNAFEHAVAANPESDRAHNNLGYSLQLQNRTEAAETEFRKAVELNPTSSTARNNLATVLTRRGDVQGALEQLLMTADAATAHNNLAVVLLEMGQYERSRQQLVEALAIRHYFAPALANFKLLQERIREEAEVQKFGRMPLTPVHVPSSLIAFVALGQTATKDPEDTQ